MESKLYNFEEFENTKINYNFKGIRISKTHITFSATSFKKIPWMYVVFLTNKTDMVLVKKSDVCLGRRFKKHMSISLSQVVPCGKYVVFNEDYEGGVLFKLIK